ncbi:unnamed protein product [Phyllotreta striolata]|uniref:BTB domain-containing protein n=1 Tax=Phyllotreta striolata TaxID=444603 RepID=A0A9N9XMW0_PHYSR|nr:unnamed protein product [Phyllotreta striolata]
MQHSTGSPQQFCLRWNNYQTNLTNVFDQLLQSESFVDVTLACDGHSVKAHKMVLSACSPYFQSLFFENPCQHPIVIMRDIKWPELKAAVEFMYKGEINVSQEQIGPLLKVAESLKIRGLADVNGEQEGGEVTAKPTVTSNVVKSEWDQRPQDLESEASRAKKRRRPSGERSSLSSPAESASTEVPEPPPSVDMSPAPPAAAATPQPAVAAAAAVAEPLQLTLPLQAQPASSSSAADDADIRPGIAEMIREEEREEKGRREEKKPGEMKAEERKAEEKKAGEMKVEERKAEEMKTGDMKADERNAKERNVEERKAWELKVEERKAGEMKVEERKTGEMKADERNVEERKA